MPPGLLAALSRHPREIHARHRARSPHTLCSFVAQLLRIDDGGPGGVHGIGNGQQSASAKRARKTYEVEAERLQVPPASCMGGSGKATSPLPPSSPSPNDAVG